MRPLNVLIASDSFKGSLSSVDVADIVADEVARCLPGSSSTRLFVADGGEGTLDAVIASCDGHTATYEVAGPLGEPVRAQVGYLGEHAAIVESAEACGLPLVAPARRDPSRTSSYGVGQLITHALDEGVRDLTVGVGGTATNDGGMGAMRALGVRFLDAFDAELYGCGADLAQVVRVDASGLDPRLAGCEVSVMCDVDNPLYGERGASRVFGPQKGATPSMVAELDDGMHALAAAVAEELGEDLSQVPGTGAAGGLAYALLAFAHAELVPGIERVLDLVGFDGQLAFADLVVTGEGHLDEQTASGKVVAGVAARCAEAAKPCIALVGGADLGAVERGLPGLLAVVPCVCEPCSVDDALADASRTAHLAADRALALVRTGMELVHGTDA